MGEIISMIKSKEFIIIFLGFLFGYISGGLMVFFQEYKLGLISMFILALTILILLKNE